MKKLVSIGFSTMLMACLILTCAFSVRPIGKDLYGYYQSMGTMGLLDSIDSLFSTVEKTMTNNFILREVCIDVYGLIQRIEGKNVVEDAAPDKAVLKGNDGKLYFRGAVTNEGNGDDQVKNREIYRQTSSSVIDLKQYCDSNGTELLYVTAPHKYAASAVTLPENKEDYLDETILFSQLLTDGGVRNINLMKELLEGEKPYSDGFFITDHHWNIRTAFWGFQRICEAFTQDGSIQIDERLFAKESFTIYTHPDVFLGSMGVRVGKYYTGMDAIDVIAPRYPTDFRVAYHTKTLEKNIEKAGPFSESILDEKISYNMYITSDNPLIHVENRETPNGKRFLLVKDSFGVPVAAWLACCCDELWVMDLRYAQAESVKEFIVNHEIDAVIVLYNPEVLSSELFYNFSEVSMGK